MMFRRIKVCMYAFRECVKLRNCVKREEKPKSVQAGNSRETGQVSNKNWY